MLSPASGYTTRHGTWIDRQIDTPAHVRLRGVCRQMLACKLAWSDTCTSACKCMRIYDMYVGRYVWMDASYMHVSMHRHNRCIYVYVVDICRHMCKCAYVIYATIL